MTLFSVELIDTHSHLNHERFFGEVDQVIDRAQAAGVNTLVVVGYDLVSSWKAVELADQYEAIYAVVGLHPHDATDHAPGLLTEYEQMSKLPKVVALGEVGLDFHYDNSPRPVQKTVFKEYIQLAGQLELPLVVHSREAEAATLEILDQYAITGQKIVMHCFGSDWNFARACIERGYLLGVAGTVTFPSAATLASAIACVPLENLLIETDCPYLAPQAKRGKRNEPAYVRFIAEFLAQLKDISLEEVARQTTQNARDFYNLPEN